MLTCLLARGEETFAQLPQFMLNRIPEQQGLRTSDILNMDIDNDGIMWLASQSYLQRFDGRRRHYYPMSETVLQVLADNQNRKWVLTRNKVYRYNQSLNAFEPVYEDSSPSPQLNGLVENHVGVPVLLSGSRMLEWQTASNSFSVPILTMPQGHAIRYFSSTDSGMSFIGILDSVIKLDAGYNRLGSWPIGGKIFMKALSPGRLLVSTGRFETYVLNTENGILKPLLLKQKGLKDKVFVVLHMIPFYPGHYLLSTNIGLLLFNTNNNLVSVPGFYHNGEPLPTTSLTGHLYRTKDGSVFLCHADGIFTTQPERQSIFYLKNYAYNGQQLTSPDIRGFAEDEETNIWMATTQGIGKLNFSSGRLQWFDPLRKESPIEYPSIRVLKYRRPWMFIGTSGNGLWLLNTMTGEFKRPSPEQGNDRQLRALFETTYVWQLVALDNGKIFVVGGGRSFLLDPERFTYRQLIDQWAGQSARSAMQDNKGNIWYGSSRGLWMLDKQFKPRYYLRDSFPDLRVASLFEWKPGYLLAGSKGLFEIITQQDSIVSFRRIAAIPADRFIYCMVQDKTGLIWIGTDEGLYRYDAVAGKAILFGSAEFVQSQAFNSNAAFVARDSTVYLGGRSGINYFKPSAVDFSHRPLNPMLYNVSFGNNDSAWQNSGHDIFLSYENRNLDAIISVPEYVNAYGLQFRYRLDEKSEWIFNENSERIRIQNLPPGDYLLEVQAARESGPWYSLKQPFAFTIGKPWWQTNLFRFFLMAAGISIILLIMDYRKKRRDQEEMKKTVNYFALSGNEHMGTEEILWDIARNCISRLGFEDCVIYLMDESRNMLVQKAAFGDKSPRDFEIANPIEIPLGKGITGAAAKIGKTIRVNDTSKDDRYIVDDEVRLSELAVPILHEGKVIGVIDSEHRRKNFFTGLHMQTLEQIAAICSSKISRALAMDEVKRAQGELTQLNSRINESKFMNLRLQMNPHFLFNALTSIQYLVVSGQTNKANTYLNIFSTYLRNLLTYAEKIFVSLSTELKMLEDYVKLESLTLDESLEYTIEATEDVDTYELLIPFMLLQPFVENAIQHGLVNKIGGKSFSVKIDYEEDDTLCCCIEDNGIGRDAAAKIKAAKMKAGHQESKGVSIAQQRLELLYGTSGKKGSIHYEDLFENGKACGTRVIIHIPVHQNNLV